MFKLILPFFLIGTCLFPAAKVDLKASAFGEQNSLKIAENSDQVETVDSKVDRGVESQVVSERLSITPLDAAIMSLDEPLALKLINDGVDLTRGISLYLAVTIDLPTVVEAFVEKGADLNPISFFPLHGALQFGHEKMVLYLLDQGADPSVLAIFGDSCLMLAAQQGLEKVVERLHHEGSDLDYTNDRGDNALSVAIGEGHICLAHRLIEMGASTCGKCGAQALWRACEKGYYGLASELIKRGADVDHHDENRESFLIRAIRSQDETTVRFLVENGAQLDPKRRYSFASTPLEVALREGQESTCLYLLDSGAKIFDPVRWSPVLHLACGARFGKVVKKLIEKGADINERSLEYDLTPLEIAIRNGNNTICDQLIEAGASLDPATIVRSVGYSGSFDEIHSIIKKIGFDEFSQEQMHDLLNVAIAQKNLDFIKFLWEEGNFCVDHYTVMSSAIRSRNYEVIEYFVHEGIDINSHSAYGDAALFSGDCSSEILMMYKSLGADLRVIRSDGSSLLHDASYIKDLTCVEYLIEEEGLDPNKKTVKGQTPLHCAVENNDVAIAKLLIEHGAEINLEDESGVIPLHKVRSLEMFSLLMNHGADLMRQDLFGSTPFQTLLSSYYVTCDLVEACLERGVELNVKDRDGFYPLELMIQKGNVELIEKMIVRGAKLDSVDEHHLLHAYQYRKMRDVLEKHGVELNSSFIFAIPTGTILFDDELFSSRIKEGNINLQDDRGDTLLLQACARGKIDLAIQLLEAGADVNLSNPYSGETPLMCSKDVEVARFLISNGADVNAVDCRGRTALYYSCGEMRDFLLGVGVRIDICDDEGLTILHEASYNGNLDLINFALDQGLCVNSPDLIGDTPLHLAVQTGRCEIISFLLSQGANPNQANQFGETPLHLAADLEIAECLIENGATVDPEDHEGRTPLQRCIGCRLEVAHALLEHGADPNHRDQFDEVALDPESPFGRQLLRQEERI